MASRARAPRSRPRTGRIGRQPPDGSTISGVHGPGRHDHGARPHDVAAECPRATAAPAARTTVRAPRPRGSGRRGVTRERGERPARGGRCDGEADVEANAAPGPRRGRARAGAGRPARRTRRGTRGWPPRSPRPAPGAASWSQPRVRIPAGSSARRNVAFRRVGRELGPDLVGEPAIAREGLEIQRAEDRVRRIPDRAGVASRRAGGDLAVARTSSTLTPRPASSAASAVPTMPPPTIATSGSRPRHRHARRAQATRAPVAISASSPTRRSTSAAVL